MGRLEAKLDPHNKAQSLESMAGTVRHGNVAGIFPEGKRNPSSSLLKGKTGAIRLALSSGAPIIPAGIINNTGKTFFQAMKSLFENKSYIEVTFGPPVDLTEFRDQPVSRDLLYAATSKLMKAISNVSGKTYSHNV